MCNYIYIIYKNLNSQIIYNQFNDSRNKTLDHIYFNLEYLKNSVYLEKKNRTDNKIKIVCADYNKKEGWYLLDLKTFEPFTNEIQSYFAGYLEGYIYHELIGFHYKNIFMSNFQGKELPDDLKSFIGKQKEYVRNLIKITDSHYFLENNNLKSKIISYF